MNSITLDDVRIVKLGKSLWHKINCLCNNHKWVEQDKPKGILIHPVQYRFCTYCYKYQYREGSPYKDPSQMWDKKWKNSNFLYETDTQKVYKIAKKLVDEALFVASELAKFDSFPKQKTKTFMHLVNVAKQLSKEYMDLKTEIRKLHIKKQKEDLCDVEVVKES